MIVTHKKKEYDIRWKHERPSDIDGHYLPKGGRTVAYCINGDEERVEAYADCSIRDTYNKKIGRIIATGRLLKMLGADTKIALHL